MTFLQTLLDLSLQNSAITPYCAIWILGAEKGAQLPKKILEMRSENQGKIEQE